MIFLKTKEKLKANQECIIAREKNKRKESYDIMTGISEHSNLVKLIYSLFNINHAISVVGYWIFDSNYKRALLLNREWLDMIFAPSVGEEHEGEFKTVFTAVRYI